MSRDLGVLAGEWIDLRNAVRPSPNTVVARSSDLRGVGVEVRAQIGREAPASTDTVEAVLEGINPTQLSRSVFERAFAIYAKGRASASIRRALSTWRQFGKWLVREGHCDLNVAELVDAPARGTWQPKPVAPEDLAAIATVVPQVDPSARQPWPERDVALFVLFVLAGLRTSEAIALTNGDLYLKTDPPRIRVTGKGNKVRSVVIPPEAVQALHTYRSDRGTRLGRSAARDPLIVRADGRPFTRSVVDNIVRKWFKRAGRQPPTGALAHSLRHTYATMLIDTGASLPEVQALLGHVDLTTTQAYLGVTGKGLADAALANPARSLISD